MSDEFFVKLVSVPFNKIYSSIENGICLLFILRKSGNVAFCFNISSPTGPRPRPVEAMDPCVLYGHRTIPIVLLYASGWSPGATLLGPGSTA